MIRFFAIDDVDVDDADDDDDDDLRNQNSFQSENKPFDLINASNSNVTYDSGDTRSGLKSIFFS